MFPDYRMDKFDSPVEFKRRMRHVLNKKRPQDKPVRVIEDEGCTCNGTEAEACAYCRRQGKHDEIPF